MVFHRGKKKSNISIPVLNIVSLERVQCTKFLGIIYCVEICGNADNLYIDPLRKSSESSHSHNILHTLVIYLFNFKLLYSQSCGKPIHNSDILVHNYHTRNRDKCSLLSGKHEFMCSNFRFITIRTLNY